MEEKELRKPENLKKVIVHKDEFKEAEEKYGGHHLFIKNEKRNEEFDAGHYYLESVGALQDEFFQTPIEGDEFRDCELIVDLRQDSAATRYVDVSILQTIRENNGSMFQAASNFNGIEAIEPESYPDGDKFLTEYVDDMTQGPAASVSAGPGAITRLLYPFYDEDKPAEEWMQTKTKQVEFLGDVKEYYTVSNGYVIQSGNELKLDAIPEEEKKEEVKEEEKKEEEVKEEKKEEIKEEEKKEEIKEEEEPKKEEEVKESEEKKPKIEEVKEEEKKEEVKEEEKKEEKEEKKEKEEEEVKEEEKKEEEEEEDDEEEKERKRKNNENKTYNDVMRRVKVGIHVGIQPTFGEKDMWEFKSKINFNKDMRISQVFCAAMNLRQGKSGYTNSNIEYGTRKAELLLEAAYRGTYLAAIRHGCPTLLLTLIGGGAFGNNTSLIFEVIKKVHLEIACNKRNRTLNKVRVVMFSMANGMIEFLKDLQAKGVDVKIYAYQGNSGTIYTRF